MRNLRKQRPAPVAAAFTLTELLIVIGLIVLVVAIAVPAFRAMSGGRSTDAAQNQLAAIFGAARGEAIGLQKVRGVFFYIDPATERVNAALVQEAAFAPDHTPDKPPDYYLDLVPDRDPLALPVGVGLQGIDNADMAGTGRKDDGYIGFNVMEGGPPLRYGGVVLFDGYGRVINKLYGFHFGQKTLVGSNKRLVPTRMAELFGYAPTADPPAFFIPRQNVSNPAMKDQPPQSLFGFVLFDYEPFKSRNFSDADPQYSSGGYGPNEQDEEKWLDQNAIPVLINRYNGTLVRGE